MEAVANAVPSFRAPAAKRAQRTEVALGALLGVMLIGLSVLIGRFHLQPAEGVTVLAQLADASLGHNWAFYVVQFATVVLLALAANTSFGGLPVLMSLLARDNYLPHVFGLKADRQVHRHGVLALAAVSAALLVFSGGDTNTLVPLFAIGVFVGFTICQTGMVIHWRREDCTRLALEGAAQRLRRGPDRHRGGRGHRHQVHRRRLADRHRAAAAGARLRGRPPGVRADRASAWGSAGCPNRRAVTGRW